MEGWGWGDMWPQQGGCIVWGIFLKQPKASEAGAKATLGKEVGGGGPAKGPQNVLSEELGL